jgi:hypothetical protein
MSAAAALAEREYRVKNLFGSLETNKYGIYLCRLFHNGIYKEVIVDDFIPVDINDKPLCAKLYKGTDFWVIILEKCWAKLNGNSYANIDCKYFDSQMASTTSPCGLSLGRRSLESTILPIFVMIIVFLIVSSPSCCFTVIGIT